MRDRGKPTWAGLVLAGAMVVTGACGTGQSATPPPGNVGETGVDTIAGTLRILAVHVVAPPGDRYPRGSDMRVVLTIVNIGTTPDTLVEASAPDAGRAEIRWDRNCDGKPEVVPELPIAPEAELPDQTVAGPTPEGVAPFDPYDVLLISARRDIMAGDTIPVMLTFTRAGRVKAPAYVVPRKANIAEPKRVCTKNTPSTK